MKQLDIFDLETNVEEKEKLADGSNLLVKAMEEVMHDSMMPYAEHVILDRALPRVEDGLKPVQRRILYSMYEQGVTPDKGYRKSARIVGDCMGRYHPHGDSSIYGAVVHMAQDFVMEVPLIDGQGNFGNIDGDGAAAMRYTEAKLAPIAMELLRDLEKDTVHWSRNFDDTTKEPDMLPGRFPNLLVNGANGIAVGLATNIPPHNLAEVIDGVVAYIDNKNITLKEMMKIIKGPDFPTGGYVITEEGLEQAYETGKGKVVMRAKAHIEVGTGDRLNIVITEIPFQVNKTDLQLKMAALKEDKKDLLAGVADIVDESDKEGMRIIIKLKKDVNPKTILPILYKHTQLESNFSINMVAIADGKPQLMGLLDVIAYYVAYQREVVLNRSKWEYEEARAREHILQGLVIAVQNIDEVIAIIKSSSSTTDAKQKLRAAFDLSEKQAQAILDLRLARITKLETNKLVDELRELEKQIARLQVIINSKKEQMNVVKQELLAIKRTYREERKSEIVSSVKDCVVPSETDEKPVETVAIALAYDHTFKRIPIKNFNMSQKDVVGAPSNVVYSRIIETETNCKVMLFTNYGNCYQAKVQDLPESKYKDKGLQLKSVFSDAQAGEYPIAVFAMPVDDMPQGELLFFTRQGLIKRTDWSEYKLLKNSFQGYKNKDADELYDVQVLVPGSQVFYVTNRGGCTKFNVDEIPLQGRVASGVKCITLASGEYVVSAAQVPSSDKGEMLLVTDKGYVKRLPIAEIARHARNCKGAKGLEFGTANGSSVVFASFVKEGNDYQIAILDKATTYLVDASTVSVEGKNTKGKLPKGKKGAISVEKVWQFKIAPDEIFKIKKAKSK